MPWIPKQSVVVPIDFSAACGGALRVALELVEKPADVHALNVLVPLDHLSPGAEWGAMDDDSRRHAVEEHFGKFLEEHGVVEVTQCVRTGDPGMEIAGYAREIGADLIVMPSHGYHGLQRLLLGSVAERVLRHADCPVLILRQGAGDEAS